MALVMVMLMSAETAQIPVSQSEAPEGLVVEVRFVAHRLSTLPTSNILARLSLNPPPALSIVAILTLERYQQHRYDRQPLRHSTESATRRC